MTQPIFGSRAMVTAANALGALLAAYLVLGPLSLAVPERAWLVVGCSVVYVLRVVVTTYITVQRQV